MNFPVAIKALFNRLFANRNHQQQRGYEYARKVYDNNAPGCLARLWEDADPTQIGSGGFEEGIRMFLTERNLRKPS